jgi:nucleotide-binding universal stress UspA family protein
VNAPLIGRDAELALRTGRVEREVVDAARAADVLVVAREGRRPGPRSLEHPLRFVVDHAPCAVLLVWPAPPA